MLTDLSIRDVVLIKSLDINFNQGLMVLTGETGAGKSILLDSLGLAIGTRADAKLVRHGCKQAMVSASFTIKPNHTANKILIEHGLKYGDNILLRRIVSDDGRSRAYVNDQPISVSLLKELGGKLVEIQGQFDQHGLMDSKNHIDILDNFHQLHGLRRTVLKNYNHWQKIKTALKLAIKKSKDAKNDEEYLRFSLEELERFAPIENEEDELSKSRIILQNAEKLMEAVNDASNKLNGVKGAEALMRQAQRILERASEKSGDILDDILNIIDQSSENLHEAINKLNVIGHEIRLDDNRLDDVEERLFALRDLARKHNIHPNSLPQIIERISHDLLNIENADADISNLTLELTKSSQAYNTTANDLSIKRKIAAIKLDYAVNYELTPLKLERAKFKTEILKLDENQWNADGIDKVTFLVATNPGTPAGQLGKVASGGELSRFLLALKLSLAETGMQQTLVFDEVDSGVGGATAAAVGERLCRLSENIQILVITHSPQVAARGSNHWNIHKKLINDNMVTNITRLDQKQRREEIARMLAGAEITDEARSAASKLMEDNL